jgi:hypothetical protein
LNIFLNYGKLRFWKGGQPKRRVREWRELTRKGKRGAAEKFWAQNSAKGCKTAQNGATIWQVRDGGFPGLSSVHGWGGQPCFDGDAYSVSSRH